jgi:outer membrane protein with beta-barrel domain
MRLSTSGFGTAILAIGLVSPAFADAQSIPSPFSYLERGQEFGIFAGYMDTGTGRFGFGPKGGPMAGARYGIELSGPLSFEGVVGYVNGERDVVDPGRLEGDRVIGQADASTLMIDARMKFSFVGRRTWHKLSPFFTAGAGIAIDSSSPSDLDLVLLPRDVFDFGTSFLGTLGLGSRWFPSDALAFRGDWLFSLWKIDTPPGYADPDRGFIGVADGEWVWGASFTVSLLYRR